MERLRQLLATISAQLSVLTVSQRVAIGLCAAMIAGSLLWLMQWSTTREMIPVVSHEFTYDELSSAEEALRTNGLTFEVQGTRVYVRPADRHNALRVLYSSEALPDGSLFDMQAVVSDPNPFISPEARRTAETYAKGNELAKIIATYPFVKKASVMLNEKSRRRLGGSADAPSASVAVTLKPGTELSMEMVDGLAKLVSGAVAGLSPHNVYVTDTRTGRSFNVPPPEDAMAVGYLDLLRKRESYLLRKIMDKLAYIPGVKAQVSLELDPHKSVKQTNVYDDPQPKIETTESNENNPGGSESETGVQANLGSAIRSGGNGQSSSSERSSVENYEPRLTESETVEQLPFTTTRATAAVSIPRSFVVGVYAAKHPESPDPKDDDPEFIAVLNEQVERVSTSVERIVMARSPEDVVVDVYPDVEWGVEGGEWSRAPGQAAGMFDGTESAGGLAMLRDYGPQAGLALLALLSLAMMMRVVRASGEPGSQQRRSRREKKENARDEPVLAAGVNAVGQAQLSESVLTGKEVDEATVRFDELGEEVSKMVDEDPEGAASLIRRWVEAD